MTPIQKTPMYGVVYVAIVACFTPLGYLLIVLATRALVALDVLPYGTADGMAPSWEHVVFFFAGWISPWAISYIYRRFNK